MGYLVQERTPERAYKTSLTLRRLAPSRPSPREGAPSISPSPEYISLIRACSEIWICRDRIIVILMTWNSNECTTIPLYPPRVI